MKVRGTELLQGDARELYRQKLARITLDSMVQFVGLLDAQGTVLEINQVALDGVGIKLADVEGQPFWNTFWWQVSKDINETLRESIRRAAQGEFVRWDAEIYGRANGKETIIIDASLMPVRDEQGNVVFIAAEGRDITEKKAYEREIARQREELAKLDELKTQFFANISHEFRTPLTLMMGPLEDALASNGLPAAQRESLELAHRNSSRLLKLVNTLLDFSRIESGRIHASYAPTDLCALTSELASVFRSAIERAGMKLVIDCDPLAEPAYVDRDMWEKIVLNLISNAFKFTFAGEIVVSLREMGRQAELTVSDTGTGIPPEEIPHLFERFHRVKGARGRSYEGSGIGLALVQELAKLHGACVRAESEFDHGSRFILTMPLGKAHLPADRIDAQRTTASTAIKADAYVEEAKRWLSDESPAPASPAEQLPGTALERTYRILLADDNADMREYVRRLLTQAGYEVEVAADGVAALQIAHKTKPDLILTDIMMPGLDGFGLLKQIRADATLSETPVVLLSARAGEGARIEGMQAGADDYLIKPFSARELIARLGSHLRMASFRQEATRALRANEASLLEADRRKDEFLATLAHELRNPLAPIRHAARISKAANATAAQVKWSQEVIDRQVDLMARLLDDLLDVSRVTRGKLELRKERLVLRDAVTAAVETVRPLIEARGHTLDIDVPASIHIDADRVRMAQIFSNLLTNAAKYTNPGGNLRVRAQAAEGNVTITVQDDGIGIAPEQLHGLFEMFSQVTSALDRSEGGLGIGLSLVRGLVTLHGGSIEARSEGLGKGSEFILTLPLAAI